MLTCHNTNQPTNQPTYQSKSLANGCCLRGIKIKNSEICFALLLCLYPNKKQTHFLIRYAKKRWKPKTLLQMKAASKEVYNHCLMVSKWNYWIRPKQWTLLSGNRKKASTLWMGLIIHWPHLRQMINTYPLKIVFLA